MSGFDVDHTPKQVRAWSVAIKAGRARGMKVRYVASSATG